MGSLAAPFFVSSSVVWTFLRSKRRPWFHIRHWNGILREKSCVATILERVAIRKAVRITRHRKADGNLAAQTSRKLLFVYDGFVRLSNKNQTLREWYREPTRARKAAVCSYSLRRRLFRSDFFYFRQTNTTENVKSVNVRVIYIFRLSERRGESDSPSC